ncbi:hypothetical protein EHQ23_07190 [Leptospira bourretii]|uniref:Uncharacterized protein n=1 Tax=Leptospira bourretii TaxID=2484962 RepID=A0A4R9IGS2_9LEPT|nr:hypothetical protein EHQ23_07190 [Leptospira bourretii]TGK87625.1 hypothetical protein EHQ26_19685 [Leptospira bourretii]TGL25649.1 hypothetical protein EHQ47_01480 [Leptospira bourretii]TGL38071.1 hypothetical protein EHQ45_05710 [Leptospira bourretii]
MSFANIPFGYTSSALVNEFDFFKKQTFGPTREEKFGSSYERPFGTFFRNSGLNNNGIVVEPCPVV